MDLFFPRAKKRRKARVDVREREVWRSFSLAFIRAKVLNYGCPVLSFAFLRKTEAFLSSFRRQLRKMQNRNTSPSRRARTKKTRLDDAERRDVPLFTQRKSFVARKRLFSRGVCVCALLRFALVKWRAISPQDQDIFYSCKNSFFFSFLAGSVKRFTHPK